MLDRVCAATSQHSAGSLCGDEPSSYAAVHPVRAEPCTCTCAGVRAHPRRRERGNVGAQAAQVAQASAGAGSRRPLPAQLPALVDTRPHTRARRLFLKIHSQKGERTMLALRPAPTWRSRIAKAVMGPIRAICRGSSSTNRGAGVAPEDQNEVTAKVPKPRTDHYPDHDLPGNGFEGFRPASRRRK